jgi:hypothetical protein
VSHPPQDREVTLNRASTSMCRTPPYQNHVTLSECEGPYAKRRGRESIWRGTRQLTAPEQPGHTTERGREPRKGNWPGIRPSGHRNPRSPQTGEFPARHQVRSVIPSRDLSTSKGACRGISALPWHMCRLEQRSPAEPSARPSRRPEPSSWDTRSAAKSASICPVNPPSAYPYFRERTGACTLIYRSVVKKSQVG